MRRNILVITKEIYKLLKREKELSIRQIFLRTNTNRDIALKSLEFMKDLELVKERKGNETKRGERLFSISK
jgi:predicted transcriptional regulator